MLQNLFYNKLRLVIRAEVIFGFYWNWNSFDMTNFTFLCYISEKRPNQHRTKSYFSRYFNFDWERLNGAITAYLSAHILTLLFVLIQFLSSNYLISVTLSYYHDKAGHTKVKWVVFHTHTCASKEIVNVIYYSLIKHQVFGVI